MNKKIWYAPHSFDTYGEEEIKAVEKCLREGWLAPGKYTEEFEREVSAYFGKKFGVMVNSGSSANLLALSVISELSDAPKQPSVSHSTGEVITCALTFSTTIAPILQTGFTPVFVDSEKGRYVPSLDVIKEKISFSTKAILLPNLAGSKPDWKGLKNLLVEMKREDIVLIEDSCDTMTRTEESDISTTSFYASHIITTAGAGGMVMFNNLEFQKKALMYRDWGRIGNNSEETHERYAYNIDNIPYDFKFLYSVVGYNLKSAEINAMFGLIQMKKLQGYQEKRRENIKRYMENLKGTCYELPLNFDQDWLAMPLCYASRRKQLLDFLERNGVQTRVFFAGNITRHPAYRKYFSPFENADYVMENGFLLGSHQGLSFQDVDRVCSLLKEFPKEVLN